MSKRRLSRRALVARVAAVALLPLALQSTEATRSGATTPPPEAPAGSVTTNKKNPLHDGSSADQLTAPLAPLWTRDLGGTVSYPLMVNGRVFVATTSAPGGSYGSELWALDAVTGATLWGP